MEVKYRGRETETGKWFYGYYVAVQELAYLLGVDPQTNFMAASHTKHYIEYDQPAMDGNYADSPTEHVRALVDPETVSQYASMDDSNGRPIFEGDIIEARNKANHAEKYMLAVRFGACGGCWFSRGCGGYMGFFFDPIGYDEHVLRNDPRFWLNTFDCTVVGNRHDNPELLEMEKCRQ